MDRPVTAEGMAARLTIDSGLAARHPGLDAHLLEVRGLAIRDRDDRLDSFAAVLVREFREHLELATLKDNPILRAYRDFYWRVGIDPTKIRPASEALLRRVLQGRDLPRINTLVDAYNLASMKTQVSIAAFDATKIHGDLTMRLARPSEAFLGIGMEMPSALQGREVVVEDADSLIAIYPYRDADATKVTPETRDVVFMLCGVPGIPRQQLLEAAETTREFVERFCR